MSGLSSAADPLQPGPPSLRSFCSFRVPEVQHLEKWSHCSISAAWGEIALKFHKWYYVATLRNCQNPFWVESNMADDAQIFNIQTPISLEWLKHILYSFIIFLHAKLKPCSFTFPEIFTGVRKFESYFKIVQCLKLETSNLVHKLSTKSTILTTKLS